MPHGTPWTDNDKRLVEENLFLSDELLAAKLGRSVSDICNIRLSFGRLDPKYALWTAQDEEFIRDNPYMTPKGLAEALNRTPKACLSKRAKLRRVDG
jgi:hypothetical protein